MAVWTGTRIYGAPCPTVTAPSAPSQGISGPSGPIGPPGPPGMPVCTWEGYVGPGCCWESREGVGQPWASLQQMTPGQRETQGRFAHSLCVGLRGTEARKRGPGSWFQAGEAGQRAFASGWSGNVDFVLRAFRGSEPPITVSRAGLARTRGPGALTLGDPPGPPVSLGTQHCNISSKAWSLCLPTWARAWVRMAEVPLGYPKLPPGLEGSVSGPEASTPSAF